MLGHILIFLFEDFFAEKEESIDEPKNEEDRAGNDCVVL
jgi:hypothetical protein